MDTKLGFVIPARNDGYGNNYLERMQASIDSILYSSNKHDLKSELVIVEWNPPSNRPPIAEDLSWELNHDGVDIKIITVPNTIHDQIPNSDELPFFEYIAKNVGIRRTDSTYIVAGNSDVIYGETLFERAPDWLSEGAYYRIPRYDVSSLHESYDTTEELINYCEENVYRHEIPQSEGWKYRGLSKVRHKTHRIINLALQGLKRPTDAISFIGENAFERLDAETVSEEPVMSTDSGGINITDNDIIVNEPDSTTDVFIGFSGDFILMHSNHWHSLCGFPETSRRCSDKDKE